MMKLFLLFALLHCFGMVVLAQRDGASVCSDLFCKRYCPNGYVIRDANGCHNCQCSPCQFGEALRISCEQDQNTCAENNGLCTPADNGISYCCPNKMMLQFE